MSVYRLVSVSHQSFFSSGTSTLLETIRVRVIVQESMHYKNIWYVDILEVWCNIKQIGIIWITFTMGAVLEWTSYQNHSQWKVFWHEGFNSSLTKTDLWHSRWVTGFCFQNCIFTLAKPESKLLNPTTAQTGQAGRQGSRQRSATGQQQEGSFIGVTQRWVSGLPGADSLSPRGPQRAPKDLHISQFGFFFLLFVWVFLKSNKDIASMFPFPWNFSLALEELCSLLFFFELWFTDHTDDKLLIKITVHL